MTYQQDLQPSASVTAGNLAAATARFGERLGALLKIWKRRYSTRRELARADADTLLDVGISEMQRAAEIRKPFWVA